jgi:hypothetical protein
MFTHKQNLKHLISLTNKKFADDYFELDDLNYIEMDEEAINKEIRL